MLGSKLFFCMGFRYALCMELFSTLNAYKHKKKFIYNMLPNNKIHVTASSGFL